MLGRKRKSNFVVDVEDAAGVGGGQARHIAAFLDALRLERADSNFEVSVLGCINEKCSSSID